MAQETLGRGSAIVNIRSLGKIWGYQTGAMRAYHAHRNAETLTVLMFHRVLPDEERTRLDADRLYTVTPEFLSDCVAFLREHYTLVSLEDVLQAQARVKPLPPAAALITFDDGWYDNLAYALPTLGNTPWTLFAATDALSESDCWWQEILLWAMRSGATDISRLRRETGCDFNNLREQGNEIYSLLMCYADLAPEKRASILSPYRDVICRKLEGQQMMLKPDGLRSLKNAGVGIGGHGSSHLPPTLISNAGEDLGRARQSLADWTGSGGISTMSFPHGRYNDAVVNEARKLGYRLLFTSDPVLNPCKGGWLQGDLLGRIPVDTHDIADENGKMAPHKLAAWLFLREIRSPKGA